MAPLALAIHRAVDVWVLVQLRHRRPRPVEATQASRRMALRARSRRRGGRPSGRSLTPAVSPVLPAASTVPAPACDTASPVRVDRLNAGGRACFGSRDVRVRGWVAPSWGVGDTSTGVAPSWLGETMTNPVLWLKPRNRSGCFSEDDCVWVFVHVSPSGGVTFDLPERWVEVTGHFDDPAAQTCRWDGRTNPPGDTVNQAVDRCRDEFVVTAVHATAAPD